MASQRFLALLDHFDLQQHVRGPTHIEGHTLDLIISRSSDRLLACCTASSLISDYLAVDAWIRAHRKIRARKTVSFRSISRIDLFAADILKLPLILNPASTADGLLGQFNTGLSSLLDKHTPLRQKALTVRPNCLWRTEAIATARREALRAERVWRSRRLVVDKEILSRARDVLSHLIQEAKTNSYQQRVADCDNDQRALFQLMDECLLKKTDPKLPKHDTPSQLAERFSLYFMSKISNIRKALDVSADNWTQPAEGNREVDQPTSFLLNFSQVSEHYVISMVKKCSTKSCSLDPVPTYVLKIFFDLLAAPLASIINLSLTTGIFLAH